MNDLPATLKHTVSSFLLQDVVRFNPLFDGIPTHAFPELVMLVQHTNRAADETICFTGERGHAMFILNKGTARRLESDNTSTAIFCGTSFGEEILLGHNLEYEYTIVADTRCALFTISADDFAARFAARPDLMHILKSNFEQSAAS